MVLKNTKISTWWSNLSLNYKIFIITIISIITLLVCCKKWTGKWIETLLTNSSTWWSNISTDYKTVTISTVASVVILFLGFRMTELARRRNKSHELTQYKQFINEWVNKSNDTLSEYISSLSKFSKEIKVNTDLNIPKWQIHIIHMSEIRKIPLERFANIYIFGLKKKERDENRKQIMNFIYQIEYLDKAPSMILSVYKEYCAQNENIINEWNINYMQLNDLFENYIYEQNDLIKRFSLSFFKLRTTEKIPFAGTDVWTKEYIDPVMTKLQQYNLTGSPILYQIFILTRSLKIVLLKHSKLNDYSFVFYEYAKNLNLAQTTINDSMKYFEDKKIKRYCQ
jgi:hypothetical protein